MLYLTVEGVVGGSNHPDHVGTIEVLSHGYYPPNQIVPEHLTVVANNGMHSAPLYGLVSSGRSIPRVSLDLGSGFNIELRPARITHFSPDGMDEDGTLSEIYRFEPAKRNK